MSRRQSLIERYRSRFSFMNEMDSLFHYSGSNGHIAGQSYDEFNKLNGLTICHELNVEMKLDA